MPEPSTVPFPLGDRVPMGPATLVGNEGTAVCGRALCRRTERCAAVFPLSRHSPPLPRHPPSPPPPGGWGGLESPVVAEPGRERAAGAGAVRRGRGRGPVGSADSALGWDR